MPKERSTQPPPRKEPGLVGKTLAWFLSIIFWLVVSLILSIIIEWVGIAFFWSDDGSAHARTMLEQDLAFLNTRVRDSANAVVLEVYAITNTLNEWAKNQFGLGEFFEWIVRPSQRNDSVLHDELHTLYLQYAPYVESVPYTIQTFFIRLAIIFLSSPAFLLLGVVGMVDGLVERDLRRWGGGRESSVVYNLARKSILRFYISACVIYLSLPLSIAPAWIIIPFALAFGFSIRVSFERFKKYF